MRTLTGRGVLGERVVTRRVIDSKWIALLQADDRVADAFSSAFPFTSRNCGRNLPVRASNFLRRRGECIGARHVFTEQHGGPSRRVKLRGRDKVSDDFTMAMLIFDLRCLPGLIANPTGSQHAFEHGAKDEAASKPDENAHSDKP